MKTTRFLFAVLIGAAPLAASGQEMNGFDLRGATIPVEEILGGGPPRDGIPSIDAPRFALARDTTYLRDDDMVFGIEIAGRRRAYPLRVLVWHEIVNDTIADRPVAVTYCPLCGTAMAFERSFGGKTASFGVSGLLYQSDVLMYDRETYSLWSQLAMKSVSGPKAGTPLVWLPGEMSTWAAWRKKHPESEVLSTQTGANRDYGRMPYEGYEDKPGTIFPVPETRKELGNKEWVIGMIVDGNAAAFDLKGLAASPGGKASLAVAGKPVEVTYDAATRSILSVTADGKTVPSVQVYWFAWQAFYPATALWKR